LAGFNWYRPLEGHLTPGPGTAGTIASEPKTPAGEPREAKTLGSREPRGPVRTVEGAAEKGLRGHRGVAPQVSRLPCHPGNAQRQLQLWTVFMAVAATATAVCLSLELVHW
jgi:hypothetical protein